MQYWYALRGKPECEYHTFVPAIDTRYNRDLTPKITPNGYLYKCSECPLEGYSFKVCPMIKVKNEKYFSIKEKNETTSRCKYHHFVPNNNVNNLQTPLYEYECALCGLSKIIINKKLNYSGSIYKTDKETAKLLQHFCKYYLKSTKPVINMYHYKCTDCGEEIIQDKKYSSFHIKNKFYKPTSDYDYDKNNNNNCNISPSKNALNEIPGYKCNYHYCKKINQNKNGKIYHYYSCLCCGERPFIENDDFGEYIIYCYERD